jgi:hypothetical protein
LRKKLHFLTWKHCFSRFEIFWTFLEISKNSALHFYCHTILTQETKKNCIEFDESTYNWHRNPSVIVYLYRYEWWT